MARGLGLGLSIVERIARVLDHKVAVASDGRPRLAFLGRGAARAAAPAARAAARDAPTSIAGQLAGIVVLCIDNEPTILDGMETLLGGWGCRVLKAPRSRRGASPRSPRRRLTPDGLLVDYHLDDGDGIEAIAALRRRFGADLPAILITADRGAAVREEARAQRIQLLNKPLKPAALRALLTQWRVQRVAAAE